MSTSQDRGHNQSLNRTLPLCKDGQNTTLTVSTVGGASKFMFSAKPELVHLLY